MFLVLCLLVFAAGVSSVGSSVFNATVIAGYELIFVLLYALLRRTAPPEPGAARSAGAADPARLERIVVVLLLAWFAAVSIALLASPLGVGATWPGRLRYGQSLLHVVFFLALRDFLARYPLPAARLWLALVASCLTVALVMAVLLLRLESYDAQAAARWFIAPPLNTHIRHTGYQAAAATAALIPFFVAGPGLSSGSRPEGLPFGPRVLLPLLVLLWAFLFWLGGRGAILSVAGAFVLLALALRRKGVPTRALWLFVGFAAALGLLLAQGLAVFDWNGVVRFTARTAEALASGDLDEAASGRIAIWLSTWETLRDQLLFGLGPQGYWFMPNRIFGIQPHGLLLQLPLEWGLAGALPFAALLLIGFRHGLRLHLPRAGRALDIPALSAGTVIVALTLHGLVDGTYYHPQPSLYLAIGFALWSVRRPPESGAADAPPG